MPWGAVITAAASILEAHARGNYLRGDNKWIPFEKPLEVLEREHRAAVKEQLATIQREAKVGAYLFAALLIAFFVGVAQLLGAF